jgi:hypothetical protein
MSDKQIKGNCFGDKHANSLQNSCEETGNKNAISAERVVLPDWTEQHYNFSCLSPALYTGNGT